MKTSTVKLCACALLFVFLTETVVAPAVFAQKAVAATSTSQQTREITIPDGTAFSVVTEDEISSKTATEGDPVNFRVAEDVLINGQLVIAKDTLAKGIISSSEKNGRMGKGGKLSIRVESTTTVDGQKVRLRAVQGKEGSDKTGTTVALVVVFGVFGFLKKGKNAVIKKGTSVKVYTDEEKKVQVTQK